MSLDPADLTVPQAQEWLDRASPEEAGPFLAAEVDGKARKGVLEHAPAPEAPGSEDRSAVRPVLDDGTLGPPLGD